VSGSVITVMREGTRSLLIEVQVLADASLGANPRRVAVGIDGNRLTMLLAVAHRHAASCCRARMCSPMWSAACACGDRGRSGDRDGRALEFAGQARCRIR
jgi:hypothetical protein